MNTTMNILILTGRFGMGHYSAASNIAAEIKSSGMPAEVFVEDIYESIFPGCCNLLYGAYSSFVSRGCKLYNFAYKKATETEPSKAKLQKSRGKHSKKRRFLTNGYFMEALGEVIEERKPDVIIATYSLCAKLVSEYKAVTGSQVPLITCITDVTSHNVWTNAYTNYYLVASKSTKEDLMERGVPKERIRVSGIPVRESFKKSGWKHVSMDKQLLIMGGGLGLLPKGDAFYEALNGVPGLSVTVIAGKNKKMYKKLHGKYENIRVLGFTDQVETYMRQADLIISKPGGLTLFEAIHLELPMLVFSPFLEQEIKNAEFIAENGIGRVLSAEPEESVEEILALLWDDAALSHMERNMRRMKDTLNEEALLEILSAYEKLASRAA